MAIASDGRVHVIRCDICGLQDGHVSRSPRDFVQAMKHLKWRFYDAQDGTWDSICPDCSRPSEQSAVPKIIHGRG